MTKSEFELRIDQILEKHELRIDEKFKQLHNSFQWVIVTIATVGVGVIGVFTTILLIWLHH